MNFPSHVVQRVPRAGAFFKRFGACCLCEGSGSGSYSGSIGKDGGERLFTRRNSAGKGVRAKVHASHLAI